MTEKVECLLIRHAQSQRAAGLAEEDWPLSELGYRQAEHLKDRLVACGLEELYTSPYSRAVDTLRPLARKAGLPLQLVPDLRERRLSAAPPEDWREALRVTWMDFDRVLPGGESSRACQARVRSAVLGIFRETRAARVAIASHGNAIALFLNSLAPDFGFAAWAKMGNPEVYRLTWDGTAATWDRGFSLR